MVSVGEVVYEFVVGVAYAFEAARRYRKQIRRSAAANIFRTAVVATLSLGFVVGWAADEPGLTALCVMMTILLVASVLFDYMAVIANVFLRESVNAPVRVTVGTPGVVWFSGTVGTGLRWNEFTRASVLADGVLLLRGKRSCYWLPDSAIAGDAHKTTAIELARRHVIDFQDCRRGAS